LREKQAAKRSYRLLEKQFRNYYIKASQKTGDTSENFIQLLEIRLDNIVYRLGLADSRDAARQLITHGHFTVNDKKVSIPSFQVKIGQVIGYNKKSLESPTIKERLGKLAKVQVPGWLSLEPEEAKGQMISIPKKDELNLPFDLTLIIEYYSR